MVEDFFPAPDGLQLFERRWLPRGEPRAEVLLVHGFIEHGGRHAPTAETLAGHGFAVSAMDLRGHGKSAGPRCWIRGFDEYLRDLDTFFDRVVRRAAGKPLFVMGHSLGGLIALLWCVRQSNSPLLCGGEGGHHVPMVGVRAGAKLKGLILSGPALQVGRQLFPWLRRLARLASMLFPRLRLVRMGGRSISRDPAVIVQFRDDPLVFHGRFPVRTGAEILRAGGLARAEFERLDVPLLILHGTADRVAAVEASQALFLQAAATDKTLRLYPGLYHEVLNEPEKEQVRADLIEWIDRRVVAKV